MCGLVGLLLKTNSGGLAIDADLFQQLLFIDTLRGEDSTGVVLWDNEGEIKVVKDAISAPEFLKTKDWNFLRGNFISRGKAILGHNRKKTVGNISPETAHPFVYDNRYVFMHNGTLNNDTALKHDLKSLHDLGVKTFEEPKTGVDSEILGQMLVPFGHDKKIIEDQLSKVRGAYACIWLDQKEEKLYVVRNKERSLFYAKTPIGIIYASEPAFIYAVCGRNRVKVESCQEFNEDTLYTIDLSDSLLHGNKITEEKLTLKKSAALTNSSHNQGNTGQNGGNVGKEGGLSKSALKRFRRTWLGTKLNFWMDDYVEIHDNMGEFADWYIFGTAVVFEDHKHMVLGKLTQVTEKDLKDNYDGRLLSGFIEEITVNEKTQTISLHLGEVSKTETLRPTTSNDTKVVH